LGVKNPAAGMRTFAGEEEVGTITVEAGTPFDEFLNGGGAFGDEGPDGGDVAESVAGGDGVLLMKFSLVVGGERGGDAALSVLRG
jgi:hypothetical protein